MKKTEVTTRQLLFVFPGPDTKKHRTSNCKCKIKRLRCEIIPKISIVALQLGTPTQFLTVPWDPHGLTELPLA